ncbi:flavin reductase family protein [Polynucleobacter sphagniphilus]|uniref:Flavin reductase (DIM6/NTAB) family NADH-FMN oxidoreductase RutF n=1 Tax=Polynucleobacter sphagniphilus TaxID=1743169 RepID=A0AA43M894_9BURK|nr:flavin reductase family protein [Polynucleobacter sphagniphilus]MDF9788916.1 flavin reductase (DIM6/NTAB) family NADH-FMN oxidoreductase RutF [Polynucleobacter sphagniphilus]MDH6154587.1 flavin reductase (DIM6/NTAB) family NADH-FMN oxidoreductase RutF [Polynucleobacter sphagniphilus]MDH6241434.1 flavin reductase (DIM6/NTAB) family NADH-FMN oxidoreductase RutF [Polynucleobacter sphagniphilus]MDH6302327.1 flavin reductase (DIM6/NTAB) family NADH-FMN oxidoreductase RutF [Polynucleobacter sphagn
MNSFYSYEPKNGHGLPHDPFNSIVGPRAIGWISTKSRAGVCNLAPYSFFNAFNYIPPIIGFSSIDYKDTVRNVQETGEFVWNLVTLDLVAAMNQTCAPYPPEVSEFEMAGLTQMDSTIVTPPRVAESKVSFECKATQIIQLETISGSKVESWLVLGEVVQIHIDQTCLKDGIYQTAEVGHVLRAGGAGDYFTIGPEQLFKLNRPK